MMEQTPLEFADAATWRAWLAENHYTTPEAWVIHYKKKSGLSGLRYAEALEEALAFGWIDGMMRSIDGDRIMQRYTPRRPASNWSESNKDRVAKLIREGRMAASGLAAVERAKAKGKW